MDQWINQITINLKTGWNSNNININFDATNNEYI